MKKLISVMLIGAMMALSVPNMALANGCGGGGGGAEKRAALKVLIAAAWGAPPYFILDTMIQSLLELYITQWNYVLFYTLGGIFPPWALGMDDPAPEEGGFFSSRFKPTEAEARAFVAAFVGGVETALSGGGKTGAGAQATDTAPTSKDIYDELVSGGYEHLAPSIGVANHVKGDGETTAPQGESGFKPWVYIGLGATSISPYARMDMVGINHFGGVTQAAETPADEPPSERDVAVSKAVAEALKNPKAMNIALKFGSPEVRDAIKKAVNKGGVSFDLGDIRATVDTANQNAAKQTFKPGVKIRF